MANQDNPWADVWNGEKQEDVELRLYAPKEEKILLSFNPLKMSNVPDWNPQWEEWHCYRHPLMIYRQDYEIMVPYFNKAFPTKDAFDGTPEPVFDIIYYDWLGRRDWEIIMDAIRQDLPKMPEEEKKLFDDFLQWLEEALKHTEIVVVEGNL